MSPVASSGASPLDSHDGLSYAGPQDKRSANIARTSRALRISIGAPLLAALTGLAYYYLWAQQADSGYSIVFGRECPASGSSPTAPNRLGYTGVDAFDTVFCVMVTFFQLAVDPPIRHYTLDLVGNLVAELLPFLLDARSHFPHNRTASVAVPLVLGLIYSLQGGGLVLPFYWFFSLLVHARRNRASAPVQPDARSVHAAVAGLTLGYVLPAGLMFFGTTPYTIAAWVIFPILIAIFQAAYLILSIPFIKYTPAEKSSSTHLLIQGAYVAAGVVATLSHLPLIWDILTSPSPLARAWFELVPYMHAYSYATPDEAMSLGLSNEVRRFLQHDAIYMGLATWLAGTWSWAFSDFRLALKVCAASVMGAFFLGPGAVVSALFVIKERIDEKERKAVIANVMNA